MESHNPRTRSPHNRGIENDAQQRERSRGKTSGSKGKKQGATFTIDCSKPVDVASLKKFL